MEIGLETAKQIYDIASKQGWTDRLLALFKKRYKVLVLGSSGVGKTNLIQSLTKDMPAVIHYSTRTTGTPASAIEIDEVPINDSKDRDEALSGLERISRMMRIASVLIMLITLANMVLTLWTIHGISMSNLSNWSISENTAGVLFFTIAAVIVIVLFDLLKRRGDAYFEELSDELHGSKTPNEPFSLKARIIMRSYSNHSSLPLIPGRFGPAIIVGVNILLPFLVLSSL